MNATDLLAQLQHSDKHLRDEAFDRIVASQDKDLLEPLSERAQPANPHLEILFCRFLQGMPPEVALPHLERLLYSPNASTRAHALDTLGRIDVEQRLDVLLELLACPAQDVRLYVLNELGLHKRAVAIRAIAPLLDVDQLEVATAAFAAIQRIDAPRSLKWVLPFLDSPDPGRQIAALNALGHMSCFRQWKRLLPCLQSGPAIVRQAAVLNLSRMAGSKGHKYLIPLLEEEQDEEVAKLILNRMALAPDVRMARALISTASTHANPQIRRTAGWIVEEMDEELLRRSMQGLLPRSPEEVQAYILTKMGQRQLPHCGPLIASYISPEQPERVHCAALEGLGFLRQQEWLPVVVPYIESANPMEAYVATLAAVQLVDRLEACPELIELLLSPDEKTTVRQQVVLQFMIDALTWQFDDPRLFEVLSNNLGAENDNIRYLSIILLGRCKHQLELVPALLSLVFEEPIPDIRQRAQDSLNEVLDGDMSYFLEQLKHGKIPLEKLGHYMSLLAELKWERASVEQALEVFDRFPKPENVPALSLESIARVLYRVHPEACRAYFEKAVHPWRSALGQAWLQSLDEMNNREQKADWHLLFGEDDTHLVLAALRGAVEVKADWALGSIIQRIVRNPDHALTPDLRTAVKEILEI